MATMQSVITVEPKRTTSTASEGEDLPYSFGLAAGMNDSDLAYGNLTPGGAAPLQQPRLEFSGGGDITLEMEMETEREDAESDRLDAALTDTDELSGRSSRQLQPSEAEEFLENNQILYPIGHAMQQRERRSSGFVDGLLACLSPVISFWGKDKSKQVCSWSFCYPKP